MVDATGVLSRIDHLKRIVREVADLYRGDVYLVGSALTKSQPHDVDIRVIVPDSVFEALFGSVEAWQWQGITGDWRTEKWR